MAPEGSRPTAVDPVQRQYERWAYPAPPADLTQLFVVPGNPLFYLRDAYFAYWPCGPVREDLEILVAGCGTCQAAGYAGLYPRARVTGIDISATSLAHEQQLQQRHQLRNLTLAQCPVEEAGRLGRQFDFIVCHGVLNHVADPLTALRALVPLLRTDGVLDLMIYGRYARIGVYMLQELFRQLGVAQDAAGVQAVKEMLRTLPPDHPVQPYLRTASDLGPDESLVDTFLHARDRAFTVGESLDLLEAAGLVFQGWNEPCFYYPDQFVPPRSTLGQRLATLHGRSLWEAMERLHGTVMFNHWLFASRRDRDPRTYALQPDSDAVLDYVPVVLATQRQPVEQPGEPHFQLLRPRTPPVVLNAIQMAVVSQITGQRTVRQCLAAAALPFPAAEQTRFARHLFGTLWRSGYVLFRLG